MNCQSVVTRCGSLCVCEEDGCVVRIEFNKTCAGKVDEMILEQLLDYLRGVRKNLTFPVKVSGTEFQKRVWHALREIPYGHTITYKELAIKLGTSPRAVGQALKANPLPLYFPCHRVVGKNSLGGFTGGLEWKKMLLETEGCNL